MIFNAHDWRKLAGLFNGVAVDRPDGRLEYRPYPGYKPEVAEAPNGDTRECDACDGDCIELAPGYPKCRACNGSGRVPNVAPPTTRYLHVAPKYAPPPWATAYLARAHYEACGVAEALGVPAAYYPRVADGTLRVLDYDVGGFQPEHTDFDLFTIVLYRSHPNDLELRTDLVTERAETSRAAHEISPGLHIGEIGELVGLGPATPHRVPARPYAQQSIVYFAMPDHAAVLPQSSECLLADGPLTVRDWLAERLARSRVYK